MARRTYLMQLEMEEESTSDNYTTKLRGGKRRRERNRSSSEVNNGNCGVCGAPHHGFHFGILSCRACASFFRRTITERKAYRCRKRNSCDILENGMRNACRACRLQRCLQAGMSANIGLNIGCNHYSDIVATPQSSKYTAVFDLATPTPLLDRYVSGIKNLSNEQRSLYHIEHPERMFSDTYLRLRDEFEYIRIQRGSIALLNTMLYEYVSYELAKLSQDDRAQLLKYYAPKFFYLYHTHLTVIAFPDEDPPTKLVIQNGCYVDMEMIENFFCKNATDSRNHSFFMKSIVEQKFDFIVEYKSLHISEYEMTAILILIFWSAVESLGLMPSERVDSARGDLTVELHTICIKRFGNIDGVKRIGKLFSFCNEIISKVNEAKESLTIAKIFLTNIPDVWEMACPTSLYGITLPTSLPSEATSESTSSMC